MVVDAQLESFKDVEGDAGGVVAGGDVAGDLVCCEVPAAAPAGGRGEPAGGDEQRGEADRFG